MFAISAVQEKRKNLYLLFRHLKWLPHKQATVYNLDKCGEML